MDQPQWTGSQPGQVPAQPVNPVHMDVQSLKSWGSMLTPNGLITIALALISAYVWYQQQKTPDPAAAAIKAIQEIQQKPTLTPAEMQKRIMELEDQVKQKKVTVKIDPVAWKEERPEEKATPPAQMPAEALERFERLEKAIAGMQASIEANRMDPGKMAVIADTLKTVATTVKELKAAK